ncbi:hypothetical protein GIB67_000675 [Kingdonia uniflora]|uniref:Uncharacterized protein n=1 Tax=Kingdonia uniflora TaxID=39325 RepID=A0A7J7NCX3_9MAGN|nr:hypothetical protein GIB67_000675 [Kingdonia uniflora]
MNPRILLLDEATSTLDAEGEYLVQDVMDFLMKRRTILVIAHRLSTVKSADTVVVISEGQIVKSGSHEELLDQDDIYIVLLLSSLIGVVYIPIGGSLRNTEQKNLVFGAAASMVHPITVVRSLTKAPKYVTTIAKILEQVIILRVWGLVKRLLKISQCKKGYDVATAYSPGVIFESIYSSLIWERPCNCILISVMQEDVVFPTKIIAKCTKYCINGNQSYKGTLDIGTCSIIGRIYNVIMFCETYSRQEILGTLAIHVGSEVCYEVSFALETMIPLATKYSQESIPDYLEGFNDQNLHKVFIFSVSSFQQPVWQWIMFVNYSHKRIISHIYNNGQWTLDNIVSLHSSAPNCIELKL